MFPKLLYLVSNNKKDATQEKTKVMSLSKYKNPVHCPKLIS